MRITAYHDSVGNIKGLAVSPSDDSIPAELVTSSQPGLRMAEVAPPAGLTIDFDNPKRLHEALDNLVESYRVEKGALKRKS
jgi:hypothetical protein